MVTADSNLGNVVREIAADTKYLRGNLDDLKEKMKDWYGTVARELKDVHYKLDHLIEVERGPAYYQSGLQDFFEDNSSQDSPDD